MDLDIGTGTTLFLVAAFVLPGFVTIAFRESTYVIRERNTSPAELLLLSFSYSVRVYGVLAIGAWLLGYRDSNITGLYRGNSPLRTYLIVGAIAWLALPFLFSELGRHWRYSKHLRGFMLRRLRISPAHSTNSAWDHFFGTNQSALVRITLDDRRVVAGYFGNRSFAAYSEETHDIYLEERWELDADSWFIQPAPSSLGIWISTERIVSLEFYEVPAAPEEPLKTDRLAGAAITAAAVVGMLASRRKDATRRPA